MSDASGDRREEHWFDDLADFLGPAYLRNAFTRCMAQRTCETTGMKSG